MGGLRNEDFDQSAPILDEEDEATLAAIDRGVQSADDGRLVPLEEVRQRMNRWLTKSSSPKTRSVI
jgi:predicted transcriptional regulator